MEFSYSRKLKVFIAMSLDGYIAQPADNLDFLKIVEKEGEDYGYSEFIAKVDTVLMGRRTYEWITSNHPFPHSDKQCYIITSKSHQKMGNLIFFDGNIDQLVTDLKQKEGGVIFCDGGATLINYLLSKNQIDELIISIVPVLVGSGIRLFFDQRHEHRMKLLNTRSFSTGLVQLHYSVIGPNEQISDGETY